MPTGVAVKQREFLFTEKDFDYLSKLVGETTGISLKREKMELVYGRVSRRLRALGLNTFKDYCDQLKNEDHEELSNLINSITTNVTHFFRENHHFDFLNEQLLPALMKEKSKQAQPKLRIWSAGCSSGNEPYSIAMVLKETIQDIRRWDVKILATDLDSNILDVAETGVYPVAHIDSIDKTRVDKWFKHGSGAHEGTVKISKDIKDLIRFRQLNLIHHWPMKGEFDIIFCRNVAIYFDKATRINMIDRFADLLTDDGYLFVGHSETLHGVSDRFNCVGKTIYKKVR